MNINICWLIGLFFLSAPTSAQAQNESSNISSDFLKDYVPPNYKNHRISIYPQLRESIVRSDNLDRNRLTGSLYSTYIFNMQKDRSDTEVIVVLDTDFISDKVNDVRVDNSNLFQANLNGSYNRYHYISGKAFVSTGAELFAGNQFYYLSDDKNIYNQSFSIPISIGFGRPFVVNDAWQAMSLFNDLECYGISADRNRTKEVADLISTQRNIQFLDGRLGRIQNRAELLNYLNDNNIVSLSGLSSAVLHDNYRFENFQFRLSGFRIRGGVIPSLVSFNNGDNSAIPGNDTDLTLDPFASLEYYLPISEDFQLDINSFFRYRDQPYLEGNEENIFSTSNQVTFSWLPNRRTKAGTSVNFTTTGNDFTYSFQAIQLNLTFDYYISPAVQWNTRVYFYKEWKELFGTETTLFDQSISIGFSYFII